MIPECDNAVTEKAWAIPGKFRNWENFKSGFFGLFASFILAAAAFGAPASGAKESPGTNSTDAGFYYYQDVVADVPWSINIVRVERAHPELVFYSTLGKSNTFGMEIVSKQAKNLSPELGQPVAAINADFYENKEKYLGRPRNVQIRQGELVSNPDGHTAMWFDCEGNPHMANIHSRFEIEWPDKTTNAFELNGERPENGVELYTSAVGSSTRTTGGLEFVLEKPLGQLRAGQYFTARVHEVRAGGDAPVCPDTMVLSVGPKLLPAVQGVAVGAMLKFSTETVPDLSGVVTAIGGGPTLVQNGKVLEWKGMIHMRHPRSALGWNKQYIFLVEVDGRQQISVGMTFPELAEYMQKLGCEQAMNLDGGGSSTLWASGNVLNKPSEGHERPTANTLVVVRKNPSRN